MPTVVPPSPEAASLFKFNEIPVSLYSGTQNTTIPLIDINVGGLSLPISLTYNSRDLQVSEVSSRVGNGWTLNYGGMVSIQIRGIADESTAGGYDNLHNSREVFYADANLRDVELESILYSDSDFDFYPDKYMISSDFYSGEFYRDKNQGGFITQNFTIIRKSKKKKYLRFSYFCFAKIKYGIG